jgi:uncharacterized protein
MPNRETILETVTENRSSLRALGVRRLGLFGSHARGEARENSDLDFLVEFQADAKTFDNYMALKDFLEGLFSTHVDLVVPETLKPRLRDHVLRETVYAPGL